MKDRHRHPASRSTPTDAMIDAELDQLADDGHTLEPIDHDADDGETTIIGPGDCQP